MSDTRVQARRAIEALRSGVPNRDAVQALGSSQPEIEHHFASQLDSVATGGPTSGLLVRGGFGSGKSHLLEYLQHVAHTRRFVTSKIVVSKETPLHDLVKVFRTAAATATVPDRRGPALAALANDALDFESPAFAELARWVATDEAALNDRFEAMLYLFRDLRGGDPEFAERVVRFWSGEPMGVAELRRKLREAGASAAFALPKVSARELSLQRFRFASQLMVAAGYSGWILLFDEVELVGRYSLLQRARSYAEIARWVSGFDDEPLPRVGSVLAVTRDFEPAVIDDKNDFDNVPNRLRANGDDLGAARAEAGMRAITRARIDLAPPSESVLEESYGKLKEIHGIAYDWHAPELMRERGRLTHSMREYVRAWINEWDLRRLDPAYMPDIEVVQVQTDYAEDQELQTASESASDEESDR
ncbi:MAG: BREX system ATP-binding domain-containing protein [Gaiellales bacterium]